jgi:multiple sugar transport system permease protein
MIRALTRRSDPFKPSPIRAFFSYIFLIGWSLVVIFPLYWLFTTSFKSPADVNNGPLYVPFVDFQPNLDTWQELLITQGNFVLRPYTNTIIIAAWASVLALIIGASASYALTRFTYAPKTALILLGLFCAIGVALLALAGVPWQIGLAAMIGVFVILSIPIGKRFSAAIGNNDIAFWLVSQRMLPPVAVILPIYIMYQQLGLLNTHTGMIIIYTAVHLPLVVWFMRDYFSGIPIELEESAFIDGASRYTVLWRIVLPLSVPGLIATFLIVLVFAWNEYTLALFLTGAETQTMPLLVAAQNATRGPQWWNISVLVSLMLAPIIVLALVLERYIARGILVGAVKG